MTKREARRQQRAEEDSGERRPKVSAHGHRTRESSNDCTHKSCSSSGGLLVSVVRVMRRRDRF